MEARDGTWLAPIPQSDVAFAAKEALAYSCNRYFAELADRIPPAQASAILERYGLGQTPIPQSREQKELLVLGVTGVAVSPAQMAVAYRKLALELDEGRGPGSARGAERFGELWHGAQCCRGRNGDRRQDRDRRRRGARPEPRMVCRHRLPGQRRSGDGDLPSGRQWGGCCPAGARLLSGSKSAGAGECSLAYRRGLLHPSRKDPHGNTIGAAETNPNGLGAGGPAALFRKGGKGTSR